MKYTKTTHVSFAFYDRVNLEKYLEAQAAQGWMVDTYYQNKMKFHYVNPGKFHFSIVYYHSPVIKSNLTVEQAEYLDYCARTGWYLVASERRMLIFASQEENPIPIETDPQIQLENIHKSVKKQHIRYVILYIALGLCFFALAHSWGIVDILAGADHMNLLLMGIWYCTLGLSDAIGYYIWRHKAKAAADEGVFYNKPASNAIFYGITLVVFLLSSALLIVLVYGIHPVLNGVIFAVIAATALWGLWCFIRRIFAKISSAVCRHHITLAMAILYIAMLTIQLICSFVQLSGFTSDAHGLAQAADMPMSVTQLTDTDFDDYISRKYTTGGTILLSQDEYIQETRNQDTDLPELRYTITYLHTDILYNACQKALLKDFARRGEAIPVNAAPWNADTAYQLYEQGSAQHKYLLCYDGQIVEIQFTWEPTAEQMAIVGQKLGA